MGSNRPFFSNFLAAFRAHSAALPKSSQSISTSAPGAAAVATSQAVWSSSSSSSIPSATSQTPLETESAPRAINAKSAASQHHATHQPTPLAPLQHNVSPLTHGPRSPPSPGVGVNGSMPVYGPPNKPQHQAYPTPQEARRNRRGSDSSSEGGYRDVMGGEKWYIGGRTSAGEERFYKLSMVRRDTSADRLSADRLSL
ncbi:hypothetical protein AAFC00_001355 [Neodothiora populina]|uniref:Uncharacterized protein n=1 Tax=Neodothiora populina TaxID=2781224 RepID=A0ABR3PNV5_9PEZI